MKQTTRSGWQTEFGLASGIEHIFRPSSYFIPGQSINIRAFGQIFERVIVSAHPEDLGLRHVARMQLERLRGALELRPRFIVHQRGVKRTPGLAETL